MDDPLRMRGVEGVGDLNAQIEYGFNLERLCLNEMAQCPPFQQFHGDEGAPVGLVNLVDRSDI